MTENPSLAFQTAFQNDPAFAGTGIPDGTKFTVNGKEYTYSAAEAAGQAAPQAEPDTDKKETPKQWSAKKDARELPGAGKYPNYWSHKTRSGHTMIMDDSKGAEHITLQHRSGSMFQFHPDGAVSFTSHNGQYNIVFGENRVKITGAQDVTVEGAASMRVDGDYNLTVNKNMNMTVKGDVNLAAKNFNQTVTGNIDVTAKNKTEKVEGSSTSQSQGAMSIVTKNGITLVSSEGSVAIGGKKDVALYSDGGEVMVSAEKKLSLVSKGETIIYSIGKLTIKTLDYLVGFIQKRGYIKIEEFQLNIQSKLPSRVDPPFITGPIKEEEGTPSDPKKDFKHDKPEVPKDDAISVL
jgi:hypothetical protein